jgi:hypothetical protein
MELDVNNDNFLTPLDVLIVINELNDPRYMGRSSQLPNGRPAQTPFYDVNGDSFCAPLDALIIINFLNKGGQAEGEGRSLPSAIGIAESPRIVSVLTYSALTFSAQGQFEAVTGDHFLDCVPCDASETRVNDDGGRGLSSSAERRTSLEAELESVLNDIVADILASDGITM